jgi:AcrR family transcriptional regulator
MLVTVTVLKPGAPDQIIRSAEQLFATKGIDGVSLREINRAAGQRNSSALQYHFGDRNSLLRAVLDKHRADTEPRRHALLDQYEADRVDDLRSLAAALVSPLAAKLADPDGGRAYLQINCDVYTRQRSHVDDLVPRRDPRSSMRRWHQLLDPLVPEEEKTVLYSRFPAIRFAFVELARRAVARPRRDDQLFTSHLTDLVAVLLAAPPSEQTRRLLEQRRPAREG